MNARTYCIREVQRDCFAPVLQALRKGKTPFESLIVRLKPFLDDGYVCVGGRLKFADLSRKQVTPFSPFVAPFYGTCNHADAHSANWEFALCSRYCEEFWILRARQVIKKVLQTCLPFKIARTPFGQEREVPMPADSHCFQALSG